MENHYFEWRPDDEPQMWRCTLRDELGRTLAAVGGVYCEYADPRLRSLMREFIERELLAHAA